MARAREPYMDFTAAARESQNRCGPGRIIVFYQLKASRLWLVEDYKSKAYVDDKAIGDIILDSIRWVLPCGEITRM